MIPETSYLGNLRLCAKFKGVAGCVVECGVWRGGMIAGMSEILGKERKYFLFDSFEGLPPATDLDGEQAREYQEKKGPSDYYDNCKAEMKYANQAMSLSGAKDFQLVRGWFSETLKSFSVPEPIAILRLDGDWYESTIDCLKYLFPKVANGGLILIDDYIYWEGCSKAVHDFLSAEKRPERIQQSLEGVTYIVKRS